MNKKKIIKVIISIVVLGLLYLYRASFYSILYGLKIGDVNKMLFENDYSVSFRNEVIPLGKGYSSKEESLYVYDGKIVYIEDRRVNGFYLGNRFYTYAKVGKLRNEYIETLEKYLSQSAKSPQIDFSQADTVTVYGSGKYYSTYKSKASDLCEILERVKKGK